MVALVIGVISRVFGNHFVDDFRGCNANAFCSGKVRIAYNPDRPKHDVWEEHWAQWRLRLGPIRNCTDPNLSVASTMTKSKACEGLANIGVALHSSFKAIT